MTRRRKRELSPGERDLWSKVARTVAPLPEKTLPQPPILDADKALPPLPLDDGRHAVPTPSPPRLSPLIGRDPQREKRVARGRLAIDAVLDLHGMRQAEADQATAAFISRAVARGHRVLLVITGKGSKDSEEGRGVLRKNFLAGADMGLYGSAITSVRPAHQRHGGRGAFYVFLRANASKTS